MENYEVNDIIDNVEIETVEEFIPEVTIKKSNTGLQVAVTIGAMVLTSLVTYKIAKKKLTKSEEDKEVATKEDFNWEDEDDGLDEYL